MHQPCATPAAIVNRMDVDHVIVARDLGLHLPSVTLRVFLDAKGRVVRIVTAQSSHIRAEDYAAERAARASTYSPAIDATCHPYASSVLFVVHGSDFE